MKVQPSKKVILKSLTAMAKGAGRPPSRRRFLAQTGISEYSVLKCFLNWRAAVKAAGLEPDARKARREDGELLADWGDAVRRNGKITTCYAYHRLGKFSVRTMEKRFGSWSQVPEAFRKFAKGKRKWADVVALLAARKPERSQVASAALPMCRTRFGKNGRPQSRSATTSRPSLLSGLILCNGFLAAAHLIEDDVGRGFPDERLRFIIPVRQPLINCSLQFAHTKESAAADHFFGD